MILADFWAQTLRRLHSELSEQQFQLAIAPITVGEENDAWRNCWRFVRKLRPMPPN